MKEGRSAFKIITGIPIRRRPLGRPRSRWEDNIRMGLIIVMDKQRTTKWKSTIKPVLTYCEVVVTAVSNSDCRNKIPQLKKKKMKKKRKKSRPRKSVRCK